jgi:DNA-binding response OmpR family regulator
MFDNIQQEFTQAEPDIVLMDINIPSFNGFYWCKKIREISNVPIIYISSRDSSMDIIMAVNSGGDDFIQKPFENSVLIAKLQAIIRRTYEYSLKDSSVIECKGLILNLGDTIVTYKDEKVELTKNEFKILKLLIENQGKVVSRQELMRSLWDDEIYVNENTLTVNVNRLRLKLESLGLMDFIATKKGLGYIIK